MRELLLAAGLLLTWAGSADGQEPPSPNNAATNTAVDAASDAAATAGDQILEPIEVPTSGDSRAASASDEPRAGGSDADDNGARTTTATERTDAAAADAGEDIVCRRERVTGSHFRTRVCYSRAELQRAHEESQELLRSLPQTPRQVPSPEG